MTEKFNTSGKYLGRIFFDEQMAEHTTFKIGGPAPLFLEPADISSLLYVVVTLKTVGIPYFLLGGGSNIVVSDKGFDGAVISMCGLNSVQTEKDIEMKHLRCFEAGSASRTVYVTCGGGAPMSLIVNFCTMHAISGMEQFSGLPGTAGGAVYMNARCFERSVSDIIAGAEYIDTDSEEIKQYVYNEGDWSYKISPFQNRTCIITKVVFCLCQEDDDSQKIIAEKCTQFIAERVSKGHFRFPCAGSIFRNNHMFGKPSGKIIDEAGLCGYRIGGAQIAPWHGNIIINIEHASSSDIHSLVEYIETVVKDKTGFTLEPEIVFCGR
jgi:UDP-N-acetylmuramate dehydrogenase